MPHVWDEPVVVGDHLIFTPYQAHQFLRSNRGQLGSGPTAAAESVLAAALDGRVPPEEARKSFLAAVRVAQS